MSTTSTPLPEEQPWVYRLHYNLSHSGDEAEPEHFVDEDIEAFRSLLDAHGRTVVAEAMSGHDVHPDEFDKPIEGHNPDPFGMVAVTPGMTHYEYYMAWAEEMFAGNNGYETCKRFTAPAELIAEYSNGTLTPSADCVLVEAYSLFYEEAYVMIVRTKDGELLAWTAGAGVN